MARELIIGRKLDKHEYKVIYKNTHKHFSINDKIVCFFDGLGWNIIRLATMLAYPVLYYDYWHEKEKTTYTNTLVVCPLTIRTMIYKGYVDIIDVVDNRLRLHSREQKEDFWMELPYTGHIDVNGVEKKIKSHVKRMEVKLLTLRDSWMFATDPKYIVAKHNEPMIISSAYYENRQTVDGKIIYTSVHPKTVCYVVQYYSHRVSAYRYTVLIGKDSSPDHPTGYQYRKTGLWGYINKYREKFIKKKAYIYPCLWFAVEQLYRDFQLITV
jgi:hypothetical protein